MNSASPDIRILFGQGSPLVDVTGLVLSDLELANEGITVEVTPYGATAVVNQFVGITNPPDQTLDMLFDDADNGSMDLFSTLSGPNTADYTLQVFLTAGSPASSVTWICGIKSFRVLPKVKDMTRARVVLTSRGAVTFTRAGA